MIFKFPVTMNRYNRPVMTDSKGYYEIKNTKSTKPDVVIQKPPEDVFGKGNNLLIYIEGLVSEKYDESPEIMIFTKDKNIFSKALCQIFVVAGTQCRKTG